MIKIIKMGSTWKASTKSTLDLSKSSASCRTTCSSRTRSFSSRTPRISARSGLRYSSKPVWTACSLVRKRCSKLLWLITCKSTSEGGKVHLLPKLTVVSTPSSTSTPSRMKTRCKHWSGSKKRNKKKTSSRFRWTTLYSSNKSHICTRKLMTWRSI